MKKNLCLVTALLSMNLAACKKNNQPVTDIVYPDLAEVVDVPTLFTTASGVKVYNGGYGSAVAADLSSPDIFYMLTDRGSNVAGQLANFNC